MSESTINTHTKDQRGEELEITFPNPKDLKQNTPFVVSLFSACLLMLVGCGGLFNQTNTVARGSKSNYGNSDLPFWSPLTDWEVRIIKSIPAARRGDPDALLDLALVASGDVRNAAQASLYKKKVFDFLKKNRNRVNKISNHREKARKIFILMHKELIKNQNPLENYKESQSKLSTLLKTGEYNCISSAILYIILSRYFNLNAHGVRMPNHAFAQITLPNGEIFEVETTNIKSFGLAHDRKFYTDRASVWEKLRGLESTSYEDYKKREILTPLLLIQDNMNNQHTNPELMDSASRNRLLEIRAYITKNSEKTTISLLNMFINEHNYLREKKDIDSLLKFHKFTEKTVQEIEKKWKYNLKIINLIAWNYNNRGIAYSDANMWTDALRIASKMSQLALKPIKDRKSLIKNTIYIYMSQGSHHFKRKQWSKAISKYSYGLSLPIDEPSRESLIKNIEASYHNWSLIYQRKRNWRNAAEILNYCTKKFPAASGCREQLRRIEKQQKKKFVYRSKNISAG